MDVRIDAARGQQAALARYDLGARADDDVDARLDVGVAGLADAADAAALDGDVGLEDAERVDDDGVGDHRVGNRRASALALPHPVADDLATAELHLLAVDGVVALDLDRQRGVAQADLVPDGGSVHLGVGTSLDGLHG